MIKIYEIEIDDPITSIVVIIALIKLSARDTIFEIETDHPVSNLLTELHLLTSHVSRDSTSTLPLNNLL